jgi:hypothetical protein
MKISICFFLLTILHTMCITKHIKLDGKKLQAQFNNIKFIDMVDRSINLLERKYSISKFYSRAHYSLTNKWGFFRAIIDFGAKVIKAVGNAIEAVAKIVVEYSIKGWHWTKDKAKQVGQAMLQAWDEIKSGFSKLFGERKENYIKAVKAITEINSNPNNNFKLEVNKLAVLKKEELGLLLSTQLPEKLTYSDFSKREKGEKEAEFAFGQEAVKEGSSNLLFIMKNIKRSKHDSKGKKCLQRNTDDIVPRRSIYNIIIN